MYIILHMHTRVCVCIYIYICMCVCVCICIHTLSLTYKIIHHHHHHHHHHQCNQVQTAKMTEISLPCRARYQTEDLEVVCLRSVLGTRLQYRRHRQRVGQTSAHRTHVLSLHHHSCLLLVGRGSRRGVVGQTQRLLFFNFVRVLRIPVDAIHLSLWRNELSYSSEN